MATDSLRTLKGIGIALAVFIISWLSLYFFAPIFVRYQVTDTGHTINDHDKPDPARVTIYSLIFVLFVLLILYFLTACRIR